MIMSIRLHSSSPRQRPFFFPFFQPTAHRPAAVAPDADRYAYVYDVYIHTHLYISRTTTILACDTLLVAIIPYIIYTI